MNDIAPQNGPFGVESLPFDPWPIRPGIQGYSWRAREPRATLLLQHGFGEYSQRYVRRYCRLIPLLFDLRISVYAFDMEGHGRSEGRRGTVDVHQAVQDHLAARRSLKHGSRPLFVLGHSLGGLVTAGSVAVEPKGVAGAIIMSAAFPEANVILRNAANVLAKIAPNAPAPTPAARVKGISRIPEEVEAYQSDPRIYHGLIPNRVAATALSVTRAVHERSHRWTIPTLILHGTADKATDPDGSRKVYEAIAANDKTLHTVEGGYHELLNDIDREKTLRVMMQWLEVRLPSKA